MKDFYKTEKVCGFYVSNMHFATMILPYIKRKIKENEKIHTFLEFNLKQDVNTILGGIIANIEEKEKVLKIDWNNSEIYKYSAVEKKLKNISTGKNTILICGNEKYINIANTNIEKYVEKNIKKLKDVDLKIINCYEINSFTENIKEILDMHSKVINTSGEHEIEEIFQGYKKAN